MSTSSILYELISYKARLQFQIEYNQINEYFLRNIFPNDESMILCESIQFGYDSDSWSVTT